MRKGFTKEFPTALYRLMVLQNVAPAELARQTGLGVGLVYQALRGQIPTLGTAYKLGRTLGVSMHALLTDDFERMQKDLSFGMDPTASVRFGAPGEGEVTTILAYCRKQHLRLDELSERCGMHAGLLSRYRMKGFSQDASSAQALTIAAGLGVTVDELLTMHGENEFSTRDRTQPIAPPVNRANAIDNYRVANGLAYRDLGPLLGLSHEGARKVCGKRETPQRYVTALCLRDGLTETAFLARYGLGR